MRKLNTKLTLAIIFSFFVATLIPRLLVRFFNIKVPSEFIDSPIVLIGGLISAFLALSLFALISNFVFMKRIKALQEATQRVQSGQYNQPIDGQGSDELSSLIHTFNDMQQALSSNQYLNQEFVRNMSHQFKTPLTVMSSLIQGMEGDEKIKDRLLDEIDQLASLTSTLLTLSKVDSLEHLVIKPFDVNELIRRLIISKQPLWERKNLEWDVSDNTVMLASYDPYIHEMVSNLCDNMIQYAYPNTTLTIHIESHFQGVNLIFSNHGPSLSQDEMDHMFDLFYKGSQSSGSGVGLNLVRSILHRLKGEMSIASNETLTTFTIYLPQL
jgi:signal transduction histidine kinase